MSDLFQRISGALASSFGNLLYLYLIPVAVALLVLFYRWSERRSERILSRFAGRSVLGRLLGSVDGSRLKLQAGLYFAAVALILAALAGPRLGERTVELSTQGVDVVILLDTSRSMLAEDIAPSRFERAKLEVSRLLEHLSGHRVALVVFAGQARVQCPLTMDYGAFSMFLSSVQVGSVELGGTALPSAIEKACNLFSAGERKYKALVVFSDGESHSGDLEAAAKEAANQGVVIHAVGVGTGKGAPIPVRSESSVINEYQKARNGTVILSRLNLTGLSRIADMTHGKIVPITGESGNVSPIWTAISDMATKELQSRTYTIYNERFQYPLLLAILLIVVAVLLPTRAKHRPMKMVETDQRT
ncbi:MAG: VWA domain-containing protein [Candidatus Coatesbacteria bacterium]|nr:VWA domain-containing protein [Candidatus Coatesbacteria bacterium]